MAKANLECFSLKLFKEDFKFSAAHFLIFDDHSAERLHGHNYRVFIELEFPLRKLDLLADFKSIKRTIRNTVHQLDEYVLLPKRNKEVKVTRKGNNLAVTFRKRSYVFPADEVLLLPMENTSVEGLSRYLLELFLKVLGIKELSRIAVEVEESPGQRARFERCFRVSANESKR